MLNETSLDGKLRGISSLIDRGYPEKSPSRMEDEYRELRRLGYANLEQLVAEWRAANLPSAPAI